MSDFSCAAVLAGGKSRRFGSNKALAPWAGGFLIDRVIRILSREFEQVMIIANETELYDDRGCPVYGDLYPGNGPLGGLHTALENASSSYVFLAACDMPHLTGDLIDSLKRDVLKTRPDAALFGRNGFMEPLPAFYRRDLRFDLSGVLSGQKEGRGLYSFLKDRRCSLRDVAENCSALTNINTPADLDRCFRN